MLGDKDPVPTEDADKAALRAHQAELAALQARVDAADKKREARAREVALAKLKLEAENAEKLAELEEEHGPEGVTWKSYITHRGRLVAMHAKAPILLHRYRNSKMKDEDNEKFVRANLLYPSADAFEEIIEDEPAIRDPLCLLACELYGIRKEAEQKK